MKHILVLFVFATVASFPAHAEQRALKNAPVLAEIQQLLSTIQFLKKEVTDLRTKLETRGLASDGTSAIPVSKEKYEKLLKENQELKAKYIENERFLKTLEQQM